MKPSVRVVLVDHDDTFVSTRPAYQALYTKVFADFGHALPGTLWNRLMRANVLPGDYLRNELGVGITPTFVTEIERNVRREIKRCGPVPGAMALVHDLQRAGLRVALWTDSPEPWVRDTASDASLAPLDGLFFEAEKPSTRSVLEAAEMFGCAPHQIVGIDNASPGIRALVNAGAGAVHFQAPDEPPLELKEIVSVSALSDITLDLLRRVAIPNLTPRLATVEL